MHLYARIQVMNIIEWRDALLESNLNYKAKYIGLVLSQFYRHKHATYPSIRTLSQLSSLTINPVQEGINQLIDGGFIIRNQERISGNKFLSNLYVFVNVEQNEHVAQRDTSDDKSDATSQSDTKVEEVDKVDKNIPENVSKQTWDDFKKLRAARKAPITKTVMGKIIAQAMLANFTLEEALQECCERGWQTFKAEWVKKDRFNKPVKQSLHKDERETIHMRVK